MANRQKITTFLWFNGNAEDAARFVGWSRATLYRLLEEVEDEDSEAKTG